MDLARTIKDKAIELGASLAGITDAAPIDAQHVHHLEAWLDAGCAGPMHYMHRHLDKRVNPGQLLPQARSVIVVGLHYKPSAVPEPPPGGPAGRVAHYALYEDYHPVMKALLHKLAAFIESKADRPARFRICVDSAPLLERAFASRAGLGFIARNHMLTHVRLGPQVFLGELITTLPIPPDEPTRGQCGDCDRCIRACPTGALRADGLLDASRCINTLTIEQTGHLPSELATMIGDRVYGCDQCVLACPFHQEASACTCHMLRFHPERAWLDLVHVLGLTGQTFATQFADSPIQRIGLEGLKRNARICLDNKTERKR